MGMAGPTAMPTDRAILTLSQWFSPAFPVGSFAYSHGLEWAVDIGEVLDAHAALDWIASVIEHGAGWNDCLFLATAYKAVHPDDLSEVDATCRAFAASRERAKEADLQGVAFCTTVSDIWQHDLKNLVYPVAVGRAAQLQRLPLALTAKFYLHSFVSNLAAAAMRLVPLGQTEGQRLINTLMPLLSDTASKAVEHSLDDLAASAFLSDIASMKHETQYSRIFRT